MNAHLQPRGGGPGGGEGSETDLQPGSRSVFTHEIYVRRKGNILFVFGVQFSNIKRLQSYPDVKSVKVFHDLCLVKVKTFTVTALTLVVEDITAMLDRLDLLKDSTMSDNSSSGLRIIDNKLNAEYRFRTSPHCVFEIVRFCKLFGIATNKIWNNNTVSVNCVARLQEVILFLNYWNSNFDFIDVEEIWKRKKPLIQSNFVARLMVSCNFVRCWHSYYKLNELRCLSGIDYVDIVCNEEDIVLQLVIGAMSKPELDSAVLLSRLHFKNYLDTLETTRLCKSEEALSTGYVTCIPYPCAASYRFRKKNLFFGISYLEMIYRDSGVILIELNEIEQTLTLGCSSQGRLERLCFEVRGFMSSFQPFAWRKKYHASFYYHIKISDGQRKMDALLQDVSENAKLRLYGDITDFDDTFGTNGPIKFINLQNPISKSLATPLSPNPTSKSCYLRYCESAMTSEFSRFLKFVDFSVLENVEAFSEFGFTFYRMTKRNRCAPKSVTKFFNCWEEDFHGDFCSDFNSRFKSVFEKQTSLHPEFKKIRQNHLTEAYFSDLGNNKRFVAEISSDKKQTKVYYNQCRTDHILVRVVDINSSKCSTQITVSSQKPCTNVRAKEFVEESIRSEELFAENVMSMNSYYSMYNVSKIYRTVYQFKNFFINLDIVSKKTNQRYGLFSEVVRVTLHYPSLNEIIFQLQNDAGNEFLFKSAVQLYRELIRCSDFLSTVLDEFIDSGLET